jgi:outer membrane biosynthesis protein TonB
VTIGLGASVLFHVLLLLFALLISALLPGRSPIDFAKAKMKLQDIELTVLPFEEEEKKEEVARVIPLSEIMQPPTFMDSMGLAAAEAAPERAVFESDLNMIAASEVPGMGLLPLPTQEGRVHDFPMFANQRVSLGASVVPFPMDVGLMTAPPPVEPAAAKNEPKAAPDKPQPATPPAPEFAKLEPKPKFREVDEPGPDEVAIAKKAQATPAPVTMPKLRDGIAPTATPVPRATSPGYQPQQQKTRIEGNISNKGKNAVDAVATPLGRYQKAVKSAIGSRWYHYISGKMDVIAPGSLKVRFAIDAKGRVTDVAVESNTSNASFAALCERAVREAEIAPPPPDAFEPLDGGQLDMSFTFSFNTF